MWGRVGTGSVCVCIYICIYISVCVCACVWASKVALVAKNMLAKAEDMSHGFDPWVERSPGGGHDNSLQYSCLEDPHRQRSLAGYSP